VEKQALGWEKRLMANTLLSHWLQVRVLPRSSAPTLGAFLLFKRLLSPTFARFLAVFWSERTTLGKMGISFKLERNQPARLVSLM